MIQEVLARTIGQGEKKKKIGKEEITPSLFTNINPYSQTLTSM